MRKKGFAWLVLLIHLGVSVPTPVANGSRQPGDWNDLRNHLNTEIGIKLKGKRSKVFVVLRVVGPDKLKVQILNKQSSEIEYDKHDVEKIWHAAPRNAGNAGKGALIGGLGGAGVGLIAGAAAKEDDPLNYAGVALFGVAGAGIGALIGGFSKRGYRTKELIYRS